MFAYTFLWCSGRTLLRNVPKPQTKVLNRLHRFGKQHLENQQCQLGLSKAVNLSLGWGASYVGATGPLPSGRVVDG